MIFHSKRGLFMLETAQTVSVCILTTTTPTNNNKLPMNRTASYRSMPSQCLSGVISVLKLSEAGFSYTGQGSVIKCEGCGQEILMDQLRQDGHVMDPTDARFHNDNCNFVRCKTKCPSTGTHEVGYGDLNGICSSPTQESLSQHSAYGSRGFNREQIHRNETNFPTSTDPQERYVYGSQAHLRTARSNPTCVFEFWSPNLLQQMGAENPRDIVNKLTRLASYRYVTCPFPETVSFAKFSESGFYYPGSGSDVICAGCGNRVDLSHFSESPDAVTFHGRVCTFVQPRPSNGSLQYDEAVTATFTNQVNHTGDSINTVRDHVPSITDTQKPSMSSSDSRTNGISRALTENRETSQMTQYDITRSLLQRENQVLQQLMKCKACNVAPIQDLFLPCGEMYTCKDCSNKFTHCPSCNKKILGTVTVFFT
ncbi:hypothetical protein Btru_061095 [Bulinus truncatus]|nr:hypothetical protein Btru_061095 [Bulinus truncatus]